MTAVADDRGSGVEIKSDTTLIVFLATQLGAALLWFGRLSARMTGLEDRVKPFPTVSSDIATIKAEQIATRRDINRLYRHLVPHGDHDPEDDG